MKYFLSAAALAGGLAWGLPGVAHAAGTTKQAELMPASEFYGVIFGIVVDEAGRMTAFRVVEVIDPHLGPDRPVNIPVPDSFVAAARKLAEAKHYPATIKDGKPAEFYTYFVYFPSQPDRADLEPQKPPAKAH